jgi:hypothetical protein
VTPSTTPPPVANSLPPATARPTPATATGAAPGGTAHAPRGTLAAGPLVVATQPASAKPAGEPAASAAPPPAAVAAAAAAPSAETEAPPAASPIAPVAPIAAAPSATVPEMDLKALEDQLRQTKAIGFMTKLTLKGQVDDLLDRFRDHYSGKAKETMKDLRRAYDLLMMKVLSLLQDEDQQLASAIVASREAIWGLLADPVKFETLQG